MVSGDSALQVHMSVVPAVSLLTPAYIYVYILIFFFKLL